MNFGNNQQPFAPTGAQQWMTMPAVYQNVAHTDINWAALAQNWMRMRQYDDERTKYEAEQKSLYEAQMAAIEAGATTSGTSNRLSGVPPPAAHVATDAVILDDELPPPLASHRQPPPLNTPAFGSGWGALPQSHPHDAHTSDGAPQQPMGSRAVAPLLGNPPVPYPPVDAVPPWARDQPRPPVFGGPPSRFGAPDPGPRWDSPFQHPNRPPSRPLFPAASGYDNYPPMPPPFMPRNNHPRMDHPAMYGSWRPPSDMSSSRYDRFEPTPMASWVLDDRSNSNSPDNHMLDAMQRKHLPAWIREGLEKVEKEKQQNEENSRQSGLDLKKDSYATPFEDKSGVVKKTRGRFESDSEGSDNNEEDDSDVPETRSPIGTAADDLIPQTEEDVREIALTLLRQWVTSILLEVTEKEIKDVVNTAFHKSTRKALPKVLAQSSALAAISKLGGYGDADGSDDETEEDGATEGESASDTDEDSFKKPPPLPRAPPSAKFKTPPLPLAMRKPAPDPKQQISKEAQQRAPSTAANRSTLPADEDTKSANNGTDGGDKISVGKTTASSVNVGGVSGKNNEEPAGSADSSDGGRKSRWADKSSDESTKSGETKKDQRSRSRSRSSERSKHRHRRRRSSSRKRSRSRERSRRRRSRSRSKERTSKHRRRSRSPEMRRQRKRSKSPRDHRRSRSPKDRSKESNTKDRSRSKSR